MFRFLMTNMTTNEVPIDSYDLTVSQVKKPCSNANIHDGSVNVIFGNAPKAEPSEKKIEVEKSKVVNLNNVTTFCTVCCNVVKVYDMVRVDTVKGPSNHQQVLISDASGQETLTLWGNSCNLLSQDKTYIITDIFKNAYDSLNLTPYSQIHEKPNTHTGCEICAVTVSTHSCCSYCGSELTGSLVDPDVKCLVCDRRFKRKRAMHNVCAQIDLEDVHGHAKKAKLNKKELATLLNCSEEDIEQKRPDDIEKCLLEKKNL